MHIYYLSNKYRDEINSLQIQISRTKVVPVPVSVPLSVPVRFGSSIDGSLVLFGSFL